MEQNSSQTSDIIPAAMPSPSSNSASTIRQCKVCSAPATNSYYGATACSPCKMFFKRNALSKQRSFKCKYSGQCDINVNSRHTCSSCRLAKCFSSGMQSEMIRCSISTKKITKSKQVSSAKFDTTISNILRETDGPRQQQWLPTLNLLEGDNSRLYVNQWSLLSNLFYSYDERGLLMLAQQISDVRSTKQLEKSVNSTEKQFIINTYEETARYLRSNSDIRNFVSGDRSLFLLNAATNMHGVGTMFIWSRSQLFHNKPFVNLCKALYGETLIKLIGRALKYTEPDVVIAKTALSLFTFSNNVSVFSAKVSPSKTISTLEIFHIQNTYTEAIWKYMLYKYGFYRSVQRFARLIGYLLMVTDIVYEGSNINLHKHDIESLVEKTELSLLLDDIERMA